MSLCRGQGTLPRLRGPLTKTILRPSGDQQGEPLFHENRLAVRPLCEPQTASSPAKSSAAARCTSRIDVLVPALANVTVTLALPQPQNEIGPIAPWPRSPAIKTIQLTIAHSPPTTSVRRTPRRNRAGRSAEVAPAAAAAAVLRPSKIA
jgi:hypothetical protein